MKTFGLLMMVLLSPFPLAGQSQGHEFTPRNRAAYFNENGCYKVSRKNYFGAIIDFSMAIVQDSTFYQAFTNRGVAKYYVKDYAGAIADYSKALEINPQEYNTYGRRGVARLDIEDCKGAIEDFTKALEGKYNNADYYNKRGIAKYNLQDYKGAIDDFNKVVKVWTGGTKTERGVAYFWRGMAKIELGMKNDGCIDLDKSRKLGIMKAFEIYDVYCQ